MSRSPRSVPPIGTQISQLAQIAPDESAVTCDGLTITRGELDTSTNRLARAYAERGVGVGDYVTMVLPNSVEWIQAIENAIWATPHGRSLEKWDESSWDCEKINESQRLVQDE